MLRMCTALVLTVLPATVFGLTASEIAAFKARDVIEANTGLKGTVSVTQDGDVYVLTSNGIPDHPTETFPGFPHPEEKSYAWRVTVTPIPASSPGCLPQGPIGMAINGVPIFNPLTSTHDCQDASIVEELDMCDGMTSRRNASYHYHNEANCLPDNAETDTGPSGIVGVAFDGYAIYGPRDEDGNLYKHADLDACNGITVKGTYRYHMTVDFPYFIGCYHGNVLSNSGVNTDACICDVQGYLNSAAPTVTSVATGLTLGVSAIAVIISYSMW